jgi:transcriptional regulator with XRE-family HTH domain
LTSGGARPGAGGPKHPLSGGRKIRACRGTRTQAEFGRLLGVTNATIGYWERGVRQPSQEHAEALKGLGCSLKPHEISKDGRGRGARTRAGREPTLRRGVRLTVWMEWQEVALARREAKRRGVGVGRVLGAAMRLYLKAREAGMLPEDGEE